MERGEIYEQLSDAERNFSAALSQLIELQILLDQTDDKSSVEYSPRYKKAKASIMEYCSGHIVTAIGHNLIAPAFDDDGMFEGAENGHGDITSNFFDVDIHEIGINHGEKRLVIGLVLKLNGGFEKSPVHQTATMYTAFAPVESNQFQVNNFGDEIIPDEDDNVATEIDIYMLNNPINLQGLVELFQNNTWTELEAETYLKYLNQLASFTRISALASYGVIFEPDGTYTMYDHEASYVLEGTFERFGLGYFTKPDETTTMRLLLSATDEDGNTSAVAAEEIVDLKLQ